MLFVLQLSPWPTTFGINVMLLSNNITPPSEQYVHKDLEYCFILLSSQTHFTHLDMNCSCHNKQLFYFCEFCLTVFMYNTSSFLIMFNFINQELHL